MPHLFWKKLKLMPLFSAFKFTAFSFPIQFSMIVADRWNVIPLKTLNSLRSHSASRQIEILNFIEGTPYWTHVDSFLQMETHRKLDMFSALRHKGRQAMS